MKKRSLSKETQVKALSLLNGKAKDADEILEKGFFLRDECGDTLWDDVLAQRDNNLQGETNNESVDKSCGDTK
jgi:hypothetical protein